MGRPNTSKITYDTRDPFAINIKKEGNGKDGQDGRNDSSSKQKVSF